MQTLKNHIALVTGASGGIGSTTAKLLASLGADIYVHYHKNKDQALKTVREIEALGQKAYLIPADLSNHQQIKGMFKIIREKTGALDILVNNAGMSKTSYIKFLSEELWDALIDTNLKSSYLCSKYAIGLLCKSKNASIVNVASFAAMKALVGEVGYSVSKAGMISMTKTMAKEVGRLNIRVNAVAPGPVRTNMSPLNDEKEKELKNLTPLMRVGEPEDVANVIAFFCQPALNFLTGQALVIDGGLSL
ncbi:MAG: hypothetical protein RHS_1253 [Robinsoniella sp. RHS]|uniref:SDR family NAD(P)-dependent oxidoreductase n=1 Tax=Robinsoniella sp. RHS TaxID=1504536 RepID=UPI00064B2641|nr:MAG: hypothetical protein RHS_1253 [Robinsoniella sp. RHS]